MEEEAAATSQILEEKIYVAVGREVWKNISNLMWALENSQGKKICILHIHQPSPTIPVLGTRFDASTVDEESVRAYRGKETAKTEMILQEYLSICLKKGVQAEKLCVEMDSIEKGIVETIYQQRIRKFVMGAAADKHYSMKMEDLKSKKANFVCQQAPVMCQIHFTCKGNLIHTREARVDEVRALSVLLSDFHRLVLPQISADIKSSDILSYPGRSEVVLSDIQEEPNDSSSQVFPCSGMGLNMLNFLLNSTKIWQKLTIQNHEHCE
ncbi:U-box domain-containing protein kinase family protein [Raphanus sativus]|nr:U-box domain-containing protein kinase family protein [Raphanus sativus]